MSISSAPRYPFLGATSLSYLKPRFKVALRPASAWLDRRGVIANHVTIATLLGSLAIGAALASFTSRPTVFALLPLWLLVRMCLATIDGTLAVDFGQKSRLGGILNEVGDIISDIALIAPLAFVEPSYSVAVATMLIFVLLSELAGIVGPVLGGSRRVDGPFGKADRSIVLAAAGLWITCFGRLPSHADTVLTVCDVLAALTIANRIRFARAEVAATRQGD